MTEPSRQPYILRPDSAARDGVAVFVRDVTKSFPTSLSMGAWIRHRGAVPRRVVLHDICLTVRQGELFGLLGANGAGKTTLLKMLATLCAPDRGEILIARINATKRPMAVKRKIGLCTSEERSFYYRLTARKNLRFFGSLAGLYGDALDARIEEVATVVDLTHALDRRFDSFSSGMRQRLSLARALLGDPEIIFLDEPTRAVDPLHAREIRTLIRDELVTRRGKTAILATNSLEEAWALCDTVAILHEGRIVANGAPRELDTQIVRFTRFHVTANDVSDAVINALEAVSGVMRVISTRTQDGVSLRIEFDPTGTAVSDVLLVLTRHGVAVKELRSEEPQPLDVFVGFTTDGSTR